MSYDIESLLDVQGRNIKGLTSVLPFCNTLRHYEGSLGTGSSVCEAKLLVVAFVSGCSLLVHQMYVI